MMPYGKTTQNIDINHRLHKKYDEKVRKDRINQPKRYAMKDALPIAPLTKVTLDLKVITGDANTTEPSDRFTFSFVCGLGIEGLTTFEKLLQGLSPGDRTHLHIKPQNVASCLEHLGASFLTAAPIAPPFKLDIHVLSVDPVSERELVKSLAEKTEAGGCGGGCGCGCGET
jgi:hypothetical protein